MSIIVSELIASLSRIPHHAPVTTAYGADVLDAKWEANHVEIVVSEPEASDEELSAEYDKGYEDGVMAGKSEGEDDGYEEFRKAVLALIDKGEVIDADKIRDL